MALGDRVIKVTKIEIWRIDPVGAVVTWEYSIVSNIGNVLVSTGQVPFNLGQQSSAASLTLLQIRNQAIAAVTTAAAAPGSEIPSYDTIN